MPQSAESYFPVRAVTSSIYNSVVLAVSVVNPNIYDYNLPLSAGSPLGSFQRVYPLYCLLLTGQPGGIIANFSRFVFFPAYPVFKNQNQVP
jgi:hypothetical protein